MACTRYHILGEIMKMDTCNVESQVNGYTCFEDHRFPYLQVFMTFRWLLLLHLYSRGTVCGLRIVHNVSTFYDASVHTVDNIF